MLLFVVLPLSMVDNSAFSPNCLTGLIDSIYPYKERSFPLS